MGLFLLNNYNYGLASQIGYFNCSVFLLAIDFFSICSLLNSIILCTSQIEVPKGLSISEYMAVVQLYSSHASETLVQKQIARTCAALAEHLSEGLATVNWNEMFFFNVLGTVCHLALVFEFLAGVLTLSVNEVFLKGLMSKSQL